jgi:hypothetical protein
LTWINPGIASSRQHAHLKRSSYASFRYGFMLPAVAPLNIDLWGRMRLAGGL